MSFRVSPMELVPASNLRPAEYNPRKADPARLDVLETSLRKLGFLTPIVADENGELLSGHQRHHVATERVGIAHLPVMRLIGLDDHARRSVNIIFNRATNDMGRKDHGSSMADDVLSGRADVLAERLPDVSDFAPVMSAQKTHISDLRRFIMGREVDDYMVGATRALHTRFGVILPVVHTADRVINGEARIQHAYNKGIHSLLALKISDDQAELAGLLLNRLSMDFDLKTRYADTLRHNSFRRARTTRKVLGKGFRAFAFPKARNKDVDVVAKPDMAAAWRRHHGTRIVDFGAGHHHEADMLQKIGCSVTTIEPYRIAGGNKINPDLSRKTCSRFLDEIGDGRVFDSVFVSSVLNSVPFAEDRRHIITLCAALCTPETTLYVCTMSTRHASFYKAHIGYKSETENGSARFAAGYEPGVALGDLADNPKIQKYHTASEFNSLFEGLFARVSTRFDGDELLGRARDPIIDPAALRAAIEFEFDLPYPDGTRMGLVEKALASYGARCQIDLT